KRMTASDGGPLETPGMMIDGSGSQTSVKVGSPWSWVRADTAPSVSMAMRTMARDLDIRDLPTGGLEPLQREYHHNVSQ
ncbi:MAG: hypothetical protein CL472_00920, partial [Acidobacteria bacterium]|nr:hypothetical protein [Acidobacteriota bacterium]